MNKPKAFFVVSEWNNDITWVEHYTDDYVIYDKSNTLPVGNKIIKIKNIDYNIYDIPHFILDHYDNLPDVIAFLEGNPFDHCNRMKFDKIIFNETFTPIESCENLPESDMHKKGIDGEYMEFNNSWYIKAHVATYGKDVNRYLSTYNLFLQKVFKNPFIQNGSDLLLEASTLFLRKIYYFIVKAFMKK